MPRPVTEHLAAHWGKDAKCPMCGSDEWSIDKRNVVLPHVGHAHGHDYHACRCETCGLVLLVSSEQTGNRREARLAGGHPGDEPGSLTGTV